MGVFRRGVSILMAVLLVACASPGTDVAGRGKADQIHLSWVHDPRTSIAIIWHTTTSSQSRVEYRGPGDIWQEQKGRAPDPKPLGPGFWHEVELTGLRPGSAYRYTVSGDGGTSRAFSFTTAPDRPGRFRFDAFADQGDCQTGRDACRVIAGIAADQPAFVLAAGDLAYGNDNGLEADDRWFNDIMAYSREAPLMPAWGNHETDQKRDPIENFKGRFALPGSEDYYSFNYGNAHFVALPERYVDIEPNSAFAAWLTNDLETVSRDTSIRWTIAFGHRPIYTTGQRHGPELRFLENVVPLFERYGVDLYLSGHEHNYERSLPILRGGQTSLDRIRVEQGWGVTYVVTGGGGRPIYDDFGPPQPWVATRAVAHQHVRIDVTDKELVFDAVDKSGLVIDHFVLSSADR